MLDGTVTPLFFELLAMPGVNGTSALVVDDMDNVMSLNAVYNVYSN